MKSFVAISNVLFISCVLAVTSAVDDQPNVQINGSGSDGSGSTSSNVELSKLIETLSKSLSDTANLNVSSILTPLNKIQDAIQSPKAGDRSLLAAALCLVEILNELLKSIKSGGGEVAGIADLVRGAAISFIQQNIKGQVGGLLGGIFHLFDSDLGGSEKGTKSRFCRLYGLDFENTA